MVDEDVVDNEEDVIDYERVGDDVKSWLKVQEVVTIEREATTTPCRLPAST